MNKVELVGRFTRDPEVRYSAGENQTAVARFTVACDRRFKRDNEPAADFISCIAFGKTAEFIERYFSKGKRIGLTGHIQTGSYTNQEGTKVYTTDVVVDECEFVENAAGSSTTQNEPATDQNGFMNIANDGIEEELPFN